MDRKKVIFYLDAKQDGSGDFSIGSKIVKKLKSVGVSTENITVIMKFDNEFINNYINFNKEFKNNCLDNKNTSETHKLNSTDVNDLQKITSSICSVYKTFYGEASEDFCYEEPNKNVLSKNVSFGTRQSTETNTNFSEKILTIINKKLTDGICSVNKDTLGNFYTNFIVNRYFTVFMTNVIKFFLNTDLSSSNYKYTTNFKLLTDETLQINTMNEDDVLLISFLCDNCFEKSLNKYKKIILGEGGHATKLDHDVIKYAPGLSDAKGNLGINIIHKSNLNMTLDDIFNNDNKTFNKVMIDNNYNVCYFGGITTFPWIYSLLMLYKLNYFVNKIVETQEGDEFNVYVPYDSYVFINIHQCTAKRLCSELVVSNDAIYFNLSKKVNLFYFKGLTPDKFLNFVKNSQNLCILSGDQSFFEGLSMGKWVIYDLLGHKIELYKQALVNMKIFSGSSTTIEHIKKVINESNVKETGQFADYIDLIDKKNVVPNSLSIQSLEPDVYGTATININDDSFTFDFMDSVTIKYDNIKNMYDTNYELAKNANTTIKDGSTYEEHLSSKFNFDNEFSELLKTELDRKKESALVGGNIKINNFYLKKYLKYKQKYLNLYGNYI